jgi:hypothetical protein
VNFLFTNGLCECFQINFFVTWNNYQDRFTLAISSDNDRLEDQPGIDTKQVGSFQRTDFFDR